MNNLHNHNMTFIMVDSARVLDQFAWKWGQKGQTIASRPSSFAMASTSNISNPTFLTENDIPGASLLGRKPKAWKISELKFWFKRRGDAGIRLKTKAELVKRVHDYTRPWFLGRTRQKLLSYYFEHFIKFAYAKLFNWKCLENNNSDCEVLWTATSSWPCNLQFYLLELFCYDSSVFFNTIGNTMLLHSNILNCREFTCWLGINTLDE